MVYIIVCNSCFIIFGDYIRNKRDIVYAKKKYLSPSAANYWVKHHLMYAVLLGLGLLGLSIVLLSFNPYDPSWFYYSTQQAKVTNKGGFIGAHLAALIFFIFGSSFFCLLPLLFFYIYMLAAEKPIRAVWDRVLGGLVIFITISGLCSFYGYDPMETVLPGGVFGLAFHQGLTKLLGKNLEAIFLHLLLLVSLLLITRLSLVRVVEVFFTYIRFYATKEYLIYWLRTMYISTQMMLVPFKWLWLEIKKLFAGADIKKSGQSIVEFETIVMNEFHRHNDEFWQALSKAEGEEQKNKSEIKDIKTAQLDKQHKTIEPKITKSKLPSYVLPSNDLLAVAAKSSLDEKQLRSEQEQFAAALQEKLNRFGVQGTVTSIKSGPVITLIEYEPHIDSKISKIVALEDDLALALEAISIRIIAPIPGRSVVGFEIANKKRQSVFLSELLTTAMFKKFSGHIPLALGKDTVGNCVVVDLVTMPHLLVAGSTGSGKSVGLNTMLISVLYRCTPDELKLILIDPKRLEFASYADIPHLLFPIITDPQRAVLSLKWVVKTMEKRYEHMAGCGVRNIFEYQQMTQQDSTLEKMPFIIVMIDELSDLMMTAGKEVEGYIARTAQMARAAGIHLIVATQRPSVDVITGLIKVNFPSRISFRVTSKADSRTILDASGGDKLLGKGDMLYMDSGSGLRRIHGAYVSHKEVDQLVKYIRSQQEPNYLDLHQELPEGGATLSDADDGLYQEIIAYIKTIDEVSISLLQRRFRIGYNRSARIIEQLETQGLIMPAEGGKVRKVIR